MNVYVFKTSIRPEDIRLTNWILRAIIPDCNWSYDLEDCDRVLRIESSKNISQVVVIELETEGFTIEELK